jgi:L-aspartate oxidase
MFDAVIVGAGGAGLTSALELKKHTDNFIVVTAGGISHSNTARAHGGIQIPVLPEDSVEIHFEDTYRGGNYRGKQELIRTMTEKSTSILSWMHSLGVDFDKLANKYVVKRCEGISVPRVLSKGGHIGSALASALIKEVKKNNINVFTYTTLKSIQQEKNSFVLTLVAKNDHQEVKTRRLILSCGGKSKYFAACHKYGTTNQPITDCHFYSSLRNMNIAMFQEDSFQFHPTCISLQGSLYGLPVPETLRVLGATIFDSKGNVITSEGLKRDKLSDKLLKIMHNMPDYVKSTQNVFNLDLRPVLQTNNNIVEAFKWFIRKLQRHGLDPMQRKIPVMPMVHYQNGGIEINTSCETSVAGIYAAGEITGGIHGTNRLMGNSLLDILIFGKIAGTSCGKSIQ